MNHVINVEELPPFQPTELPTAFRPCPFCGATPAVTINEEKLYRIECLNIDCNFYFMAANFLHPAERWNRRISDTQLRLQTDLIEQKDQVFATLIGNIRHFRNELQEQRDNLLDNRPKPCSFGIETDLNIINRAQTSLLNDIITMFDQQIRDGKTYEY